MRIAHLTSAHPRAGSRIFRKQCCSLVRAGHEVFEVVADGLGDETRDGVRIVDAGKSSGRLNRMLRAPWRVCRAGLTLDADIYHLHDPELIPVGLRLRLAGRVVVFDSHEDLPKQILSKSYIHPALRRITALLASAGEWMALPWFSALVGATPSIRDRMARFRRNAVAINNFPLPGELAPQQDAAQARENSVCFVGAMTRIRGIVEMIDAVEKTRSRPKLEIAGKFSEPALERDSKALPGWKNAVHHGFLDRDGVRDLMARAQIGILPFLPVPNHVEALPNKLFEYMSASLPVVASDFPYWRDIIEKADCGLCADPEDPAAIAAAIDQILDDPERARQMGENGVRAVREIYNWSREEEKLLALYAELIPAGQTQTQPAA